MKKLPLLFCLSLMFFGLQAQKIDTEQLKGLKIRNIGPAGMSGRITSIDVDLSDPDRIFIGTASGGAWKSESGGIAWEPIFDKEAVQSVGALTINQNNPSEIWIGTGEGNPRNSANSGAGIYKSLDGGKTWKLMGLEATKTIHRIIIHRDNPDVVYVGAQGSAWGPNKERGIYKTTDGGKTWDKVLYINDETGCADLVVDPTNPNKLIAAMWEFGRKPWTFNSGGKGSGIFVSHDAGETWVRRTEKDGLPKGILGRVGLAIAPSKPNIIYALVEAKENALYKSIDGGANWKKISTDNNIGNRPFYYSDIFVDPQNENRVFSLWSRVSRSEDGGKTWALFGNRGVHPDHHAFWIHPEDPNYMIGGNDGGLNISRDGGYHWQFVENLPLAQFYHIDYDMEIPYNVGGGMQDNGSWIGPSSIWQRGGIRNEHWEEIYFGDGFDVAMRPDDNRYAYAMSQGGNLGYVDRETGRTQFIRPTHPDSVALRFNWNAAFAQNPFYSCGIYYGSQFVHKSNDCGQTWEIISPDLTTNDTTKQQQETTGGLTIDNTRAENHTTILAIAPSPVDANLLWIGTDDGRLHITRDGGRSWTELSDKLGACKPGAWIPYIEVSKKQAGEAFVVVNDYRRNDWRPVVYHTTDFGASFKRIVDEKQVSGHALSIVQDPEAPNHLWLGTDFGLYFSIDGGDNWNKWMNNYPSVPTADLKIHSRDQDLIVGTFGRAAWILDDLRPFREMAKTGGKVLEQAFKVFEAPDAYLANYRSVDGTRFIADFTYTGDNKPSGAMITVWMKKDKKEDKAKGKDEKKGKKKKEDKVKVEVYSSYGDKIRTFTEKIDTGMTRIYWNLRRDGVKYPSRRSARPGQDGPAGQSVLPGTYKLVLSYGDHKDSTNLTVHQDPRREIPMDDLQAKDAAYEEFYGIVEMATKGFDQLQEARKNIKRVNEALSAAPDSTQKEVKAMGKELIKSIEQLEKIYMQPDGLKGIQRVYDNLNATLRGTSGYLRALEGAPNQAANRMMNTARMETEDAVEAINEFLENDFKAYQEKVEAIQFSLFKPLESVKMK